VITCFVCHKELINCDHPEPSIDKAKALISRDLVAINDWPNNRMLIFCSKDCWRSVKQKKGYKKTVTKK